MEKDEEYLSEFYLTFNNLSLSIRSAKIRTVNLTFGLAFFCDWIRPIHSQTTKKTRIQSKKTINLDSGGKISRIQIIDIGSGSFFPVIMTFHEKQI